VNLERTNYSSGAPLEESVGYSRVVKLGPFIYVGGTTSVQADGTVYGEGDGYLQTKFILEKMLKCLEEAGGKKEEVFRVKMYVTDMTKTKDYLKAYSEFFKEIKPLCTLAGIAALNRPSQLIEIEIDAAKGGESL
jgi:enamine deaminase RidA (YjgF/YER057c/UK114 family)